MSDLQDNLPRDGSGESAPADAASVELFDFYVAQLEAYLDGELDAEEASQVRRRLMQEEAYAAALGRLHAQRVQRVEAYQRIERVETDNDAATRIAAAARRMALQENATPGAAAPGWPTWTKLVFGMAAYLLVGFGAGLVGVYDFGEAPPQITSKPVEPDGPGLAGEDTGARWIYIDENNQQQAVIPAEHRPMQSPVEQPPDRTLPTTPR